MNMKLPQWFKPSVWARFSARAALAIVGFPASAGCSGGTAAVIEAA